MLPLVSIIIPVYNTAKYLKNCLDSVVNQSYPNIEIIVINDCSTDCSQAIMNHYAQNYHNIKIVDSPLRLLPGGARNVGLDLSQGEYIYFLDSDDFIYPIFTRARSWAKTDKILYYYRRNLHSITISSKLFPNERILDVYSCLEYMYNTCKNIGSYEEFKDIIEKISQRIAIYPLLECCLWLGISKVDSFKWLS